MKNVTLTADEAACVVGWLDTLSGGNLESIFSSNGPCDLADAVAVKLLDAVDKGHCVPLRFRNQK